MMSPPSRSTLFPYTTLFRSQGNIVVVELKAGTAAPESITQVLAYMGSVAEAGNESVRDRKSTRLNSSHITISYAVFCLKKKKHNKQCTPTMIRSDHRLNMTP